MAGGPRVAVLLPQTYMNDSGTSAGPARGALKVPLDHVIVVYDEIDLPFGEIRAKLGGGLAGHNGMKSMKAGLGSADFRRVRVGVGRPDTTDPEIVAGHVLGKWRQPKADVEALVDDAVRTVAALVEDADERRVVRHTLVRDNVRSMMTHDWDAETYSRSATRVHAIAAENLDRLRLRGDETVLDAGCGSGEVTEALLERLPEGRVLCVDASPAMVARLRERLGDRVTAWVQDLAELELPEPVDAVFSTATFHWIPDHQNLFDRLHARAEARRPARRPVRRRRQHRAVARGLARGLQRGAVRRRPGRVSTPGTTRRRPRPRSAWPAPAFATARAWLLEREMDTPDPDGFLRSTFFGAHLARLRTGASRRVHRGRVGPRELPRPLRAPEHRSDRLRHVTAAGVVLPSRGNASSSLEIRRRDGRVP